MYVVNLPQRVTTASITCYVRFTLKPLYLVYKEPHLNSYKSNLFFFFLFLLSKGYLVQVSTYKQSSFSVYEISVKDAKPGQARETGTVWLA